MSDENTVLDTLKFKDGKIFLREHHIDRSFEALTFIKAKVSRDEIENFYLDLEQTFSEKADESHLLRIKLNFDNKLQSTIELLKKSSFQDLPQVQLVKNVIKPSGAGKESYKWAHRKFWQNALSFKHPIADDIICINTDGYLTETSRCNIFLFDPKIMVVKTPPLHSGCINGVYRRFILKSGYIMLPQWGATRVIEENLLEEDLFRHAIYLANSVREVMASQLFTRNSTLV